MIRTTKDESDQKPGIKVAISQIIPVTVKNFLLLGFGMINGYPTILIPKLSKDTEQGEFLLNEEQLSWIGSLSMLSLPIGSIVSGILSQSIGRKITMQVSCAFIIAGWLIIRFCNEIWQMYVSLVILGLAAGLLESPVLTYVGEITEPRLRGALLSTGGLSVTLGTMVEFVLGSGLHWRTVSLFSAIPPLAAFVLLFFLPESPHWLIMKNKMEEAKKSLAWLRGWTTVAEIEQEFQELVVNNSSKFNASIKCLFNFKDFLKPQFTRPFILICYVFLLYNLSGISTLPVYAVQIFESFKAPIDKYNATVLLGLALFLGSLTCVCVVAKTGKRVLAFIALIVAGTGFIIVASYAHLTNTCYLYTSNEINEGDRLDHRWIPLLFILITAFSLSCGVRTLPWNLLAEVFPLETRSVATGALAAYAYILGFLSSKTFFALVAGITIPGVLWFYGCVCLISFVVLYFWLPETEGKTLQSITDHFAKRNKLGYKIGTFRVSCSQEK